VSLFPPTALSRHNNTSLTIIDTLKIMNPKSFKYVNETPQNLRLPKKLERGKICLNLMDHMDKSMLEYSLGSCTKDQGIFTKIIRNKKHVGTVKVSPTSNAKKSFDFKNVLSRD